MTAVTAAANAPDELTAIWDALASLSDPELPIISIVDLGIVREVSLEGPLCRVMFAPTFLGCPATGLIQRSIVARLAELGHEPEVLVSYERPWTVGDVSERGRAALRNAGIVFAERGVHHDGVEALQCDRVRCPHCDAVDNRLLGLFGATRCRVARRCANCGKMFEQMKSY